MRISTNQFNQLNQSRMMQAYSALGKSQQQIATGKEQLSMADSPYRTAAAMRSKDVLRQNERFTENLDRLDNRYSSQDSTIQSIISAATRLRDLSLKASNQTMSVDDQRVVATEVRELTEMIVNFANSRDADGQFLFSGFDNRQPPVKFTEDGDNGYAVVAFDDREGQLEVANDTFLSTGLTAAEIFGRVDAGGAFQATSESELLLGQPIVIDDSVTTAAAYTITFTAPNAMQITDDAGNVVSNLPYVSGESFVFDGMRMSLSGAPTVGDEVSINSSQVQDMFSRAFSMSDALKDETLSSAERVSAALDLVGTMDQVIGSASDALTKLGTRMSRVEQQREYNLDFDVYLQDRIQDFEGVDFAEAISQMEAEMTTLQAVQKSYSRIAGLSLFDQI